jgi:hypothetical protein
MRVQKTGKIIVVHIVASLLCSFIVPRHPYNWSTEIKYFHYFSPFFPGYGVAQIPRFAASVFDA